MVELKGNCLGDIARGVVGAAGHLDDDVSRLDEAAQWYDEALKIDPGSVEATANLARTRIRQGHKDPRTRELLQNVVMKDPRPEWTQWATRQLALMGNGRSSVEPPQAAEVQAPRNAPQPVTPTPAPDAQQSQRAP
jgi:cytochrome c-type biogenesis protein CcmH/NrfG